MSYQLFSQESRVLTEWSLPSDHRDYLSKKLFKSIVDNPEHKLFNLLQNVNITNYSLRKERDFIIPKSKTNRFKQAFIPARASDFYYNNF